VTNGVRRMDVVALSRSERYIVLNVRAFDEGVRTIAVEPGAPCEPAP
jgi:hypothetical protein